MSSQLSEEDIRRIAESRVAEKKGFFIHLTIYILVNALLAIIWALTSFASKSWFPWFVFPLAGWGIGLLIHCLNVFAFPKAGSDWERKEIQKEMDRLRKGP
jgi:hypothetical protein